MTSKKALLDKINGLVLVTEDNRKRLKELVQNLETESEFAKVEELLTEEPRTFKRVLKSLVNTEVSMGKSSILEVIDESLKTTQIAGLKAAHLEEHAEKNSEQEKAEALLHDF